MTYDQNRFVQYYVNQAGGSLPGFYGAPVMYGRGIGSLFSKLFRFVSPLVKKGFAFVKPHLKTAAKNIASDAIGNVMQKMSRVEAQEGSGIMILSKRPRKRPPGQRLMRFDKKGVERKIKSVKKRKVKRRKSSKSSDIF